MKLQQQDPKLWNYITSVPLFCGYFLYGLGAVLFTLALRDGELSVLYPVISLTYVWVAILSVPILELAHTAKSISDKRDYTLRASKHSEDEIGAPTAHRARSLATSACARNGACTRTP